ncbi:MAG: dihydroorotate dehydrogenase-like protein [Ignavibacteriales bacterium]|nr:dihydroorotate dehydrogenase-like protein [Ignavibacteriales bacterium]
MDLSTTYLGLTLKNPIVPSASPMSRTVASIKSMEDFGASAVVLYSLFEEQIRHETKELNHFLDYGSESFAEAVSYFPDHKEYYLGPEEYLEHIRKVKAAVSIPVIASLNGSTVGGWTEHAARIQEAGADALELNIYYIPTNPDTTGGYVEQLYLEILQAVKSKVTIPVAVKLSPFFSSLANMAKRLDENGANGLVLFNRFYQPDINLEALEVEPSVVLSSSDALRLPLRWVAILHKNIKADLAATTGIHTAEDVIKITMAGASVAQVCSTLLRYGPKRIAEILNGIEQWMEEHEYESLTQMRGSMSHKSVANPSAFERANYMKALNSYM